MLRLQRVGVRVEVVQVLSSRTRFTCAGCMGDDVGKEAWIQPGRLRIAGAHGEVTDPLSVALRLRARWAGGTGLPDGMTSAMGCLLIDHGFTLAPSDPPRATWSAAGGELVMEWQDGRWQQVALTPTTEVVAWSCRTTRPS